MGAAPIKHGQTQLALNSVTMVSLDPSSSFGRLTRTVVKKSWVYLWRCSMPNNFICGKGNGRPTCDENTGDLFDFHAPTIVLRDAQQPGGVNAVKYFDTSAYQANVLPNIAPPATNASNNNSSKPAPSTHKGDALAVGLGVGLPFGALLLASWIMIYVLYRRLQTKKEEVYTNKETYLADLAAAVDTDKVYARGKALPQRPRRIGEMPAGWHPPEAGSSNNPLELETIPAHDGTTSAAATSTAGTSTRSTRSTRSIF